MLAQNLLELNPRILKDFAAKKRFSMRALYYKTFYANMFSCNLIS
jgi:hypothetical protein